MYVKVDTNKPPLYGSGQVMFYLYMFSTSLYRLFISLAHDRHSTNIRLLYATLVFKRQRPAHRGNPVNAYKWRVRTQLNVALAQ